MNPQTIPKRFKFATVAIILFLVLSILLLVYTYYRAEITYQGNMTEKYFKYYVISLVGILLWGTVLRLKDEIKINILLVTTSLVVGIYLVEITLNFVDHSNQPRAKVAAKYGVKYDTRTKLQVVKDLREEGVDAITLYHPRLTLATNGIPGSESLFPFAGVSKTRTVLCNESGEYSIYLSDRYGFNNPDSEWDIPTDWILTGDSYTVGSCVQPGEDFAGQIRLITGENVINLGMSGNGPLIELAALKEYAELRKPKTVIWIYYANDLGNLTEEISAPLLMNYLQPEFSQRLIYRQKEIDNRLNKFITEATVKYEKKVALAQIKRENFSLRKTKMMRLFNIRQRLGFDTLTHSYVVGERFSEVLTKARNRVSAWGGKLYFVYLPECLGYTSLCKSNSNIVKAVTNLNIPLIDFHQELSHHPDPLSLVPFRYLPSHFTAEGYAEIAKVIVTRVRALQKGQTNN